MSLDAKLRVIGAVTRKRGSGELVKRVGKLIYSTSECYVLRRELTRPLVPRSEANVPSLRGCCSAGFYPYLVNP